MSSSDEVAAAADSDRWSDLVLDLDQAPDAALRVVFAAVVQAYAARADDDGRVAVSPFPDGHTINATDVMIATTAMLRAAGVQLFELGMWQSWSGNH